MAPKAQSTKVSMKWVKTLNTIDQILADKRYKVISSDLLNLVNGVTQYLWEVAYIQ